MRKQDITYNISPKVMGRLENFFRNVATSNSKSIMDILASANNEELDNLLKYIFMFSKGRIGLSSEGFKILNRCNKKTCLAEHFESKQKINELIRDKQRKKKLDILKKVKSILPRIALEVIDDVLDDANSPKDKDKEKDKKLHQQQQQQHHHPPEKHRRHEESLHDAKEAGDNKSLSARQKKRRQKQARDSQHASLEEESTEAEAPNNRRPRSKSESPKSRSKQLTPAETSRRRNEAFNARRRITEHELNDETIVNLDDTPSSRSSGTPNVSSRSSGSNSRSLSMQHTPSPIRHVGSSGGAGAAAPSRKSSSGKKAENRDSGRFSMAPQAGGSGLARSQHQHHSSPKTSTARKQSRKDKDKDNESDRSELFLSLTGSPSDVQEEEDEALND